MDLEYMKNIKGKIIMTFKEKLFIDHPEYINDTNYFIYVCPSDYGYEEPKNFFEYCAGLECCCEECWEREMEA